MIKKYTFKFDELDIDYLEINRVLGFSGNHLPEPFSDYLQQAKEECQLLNDIGGVFFVNSFNLAKSHFSIGETIFKPGTTICEELNGADHIAVFICTAGATISERASLLMNQDPVIGYVYDVLGSAIVEAVGDKISALVKSREIHDGVKTTNRYSPGYCHWNISEQHKLFTLFENDTCGVTLSESSLMSPIKSISGIIGIGKEVKYRNYQCDLCNMANCANKMAKML